MSEKQLRDTIADLERTLDQQESIDAAVREQLTDLVQEIQGLLDSAPDERRDAEPSLLDRLSAAMDEFEESYPALTAAVGRLATALSNLGI
jgi:ABC-type transporter Mla subunit MlaD